MKLHKKTPGSVRHVKWDNECYVNANDLVDMFEKWDYEAAPLLASYFKSIILDCVNLVHGMEGDQKKQWQDIMKPN